MNTNGMLAVVVSGLFLAVGGCAEMQRHGDIDAAPSAVKNAAMTAAGGHRIEKFESETEDGKTVYEVSFEADGIDHTITLDGSGAAIEEEVEIKVADLPPAVAAAVLKAQPLAHVKKAERVKKGDTTYFEIDAKIGDDKHELSIAADGTLMSDKVEHDEHEGHGEGHEHGDKD